MLRSRRSSPTRESPRRRPRDGGELAHQPLALADPLQRPRMRCGVRRSGIAPVARYSVNRRAASKAAECAVDMAQHGRGRGQIIVRGPLDQAAHGRGNRRSRRRRRGSRAGDCRRSPRSAAARLPTPRRRTARAGSARSRSAGRDLHARRHAIVERPQSRGGLRMRARAMIDPSYGHFPRNGNPVSPVSSP